MKLRNHVYKYRAFTDNVMFIMENQKNTIPRLFTKIEEFGELAGFYINKNKTKIMCKNMQSTKQEELKSLTGCEVACRGKYLGRVMTTKNLDLFKNNYEKVWEEVQKDFST